MGIIAIKNTSKKIFENNSTKQLQKCDMILALARLWRFMWLSTKFDHYSCNMPRIWSHFLLMMVSALLGMLVDNSRLGQLMFCHLLKGSMLSNFIPWIRSSFNQPILIELPVKLCLATFGIYSPTMLSLLVSQ